MLTLRFLVECIIVVYCGRDPFGQISHVEAESHLLDSVMVDEGI